MSLSLHTLAPKPGARKTSRRVGRGYASGRGTTAGRGTKGQRARTGGRKRLKLKGLKQMLLAFPKTRGFQSKFPTVYAVPVDRILPKFQAGARIDLDALKKAGLVPKSATLAKVIGNDAIDKALTFVNIRATTTAKAAIEKAGGKFMNPKPKKSKNTKKDAKKSS